MLVGKHKVNKKWDDLGLTTFMTQDKLNIVAHLSHLPGGLDTGGNTAEVL